MPGGVLSRALTPLLDTDEVLAMQIRAELILEEGIFPLPPEDRRAYPWPLV